VGRGFRVCVGEFRGSFRIGEADFRCGLGGRGCSDDGRKTAWGEVAVGGLGGAATATVRSPDVPEDGDGGPEQRCKSQNRDGYKNAHKPCKG